MDKNSKVIIKAANGEEWSVPVMKIIENRAHYYAIEDGHVKGTKEWDECVEEETNAMLEDNVYNIQDWGQNNMDWKDVEQHATKVSDAKPTDMKEAWINGDWRFE